jgi:hypothetical protein
MILEGFHTFLIDRRVRPYNGLILRGTFVLGDDGSFIAVSIFLFSW